MRTLSSSVVAAAFIAAAVPAASNAAPAPQPPGPEDCSPSNGLNFVCGTERPEDLKHIPGTRWIIASGFFDGAGMKLVDSETKTARRWWSGVPAEIRPDKDRYGVCLGPPDPKLFNTHGLSLRPHGDGRHTLYAVNHGGREAIEVFEVDARGPVPAPVWVGCVPMPQGLSANSTAAFPDGTILASVLTHPGKTLADQVLGRITGGVYQWRPGEAGFRLLPGTEQPGNNGIETSPDGREFYVIGFGVHTVFIYDRADTSKPARQTVAPGFMPDNLAWDPAPGGEGSRVIAAGMVFDEPACGGTRKVVNGVADGMRCPRGYVVGALDPRTLTWSIVDYAEPNPAFNGVSSAVVVGDNVWLGSYQSNRIAWRLLPDKRAPGR